MQILLSVIVLTYNHRNFVAAALDSIRAQEVDFDFEVILADDASRDGTTEIIESHLTNWAGFRGKPIILFRDKNMGMQRNAINAIERSRGKYIAFLEGDDYWMDSNKIALQVRFLEANPEYFLCSHKTMIQIGDEIFEKEWRLNKFRERYSVKDYIERLFFHTSSIVLKKSGALPKWLESVMQLDQALVILNSSSRADKIRVLPRFMSVYRIHPSGITQSSAHKNKDLARWSHARLLCGITRECPWISRGAVRNKLREVIVLSRMRSAESICKKYFMLLCNTRIVFRLLIYKYLSARVSGIKPSS
jgi:glycosyltransferase involved in cell wall biosynthesis